MLVRGLKFAITRHSSGVFNKRCIATTGATAKNAFVTKPAEKDPYQYQVGFGNRFASEAM